MTYIFSSSRSQRADDKYVDLFVDDPASPGGAQVGVGSTTGVSFAFAVGVGSTTRADLRAGSSQNNLRILRVGDLDEFFTDRAESFTPVYESPEFRTSHHFF